MQSARARNYTAGGAIPARSLVKLSADRTVVVATAATDDIIGVSADLDAVQGGRVDVYRAGMVAAIAGGNIARGQPVTSNNAGRAVAAAPAAGTRARFVGIAEVSAVAGDMFDVEIGVGFITTPA